MKTKKLNAAQLQEKYKDCQKLLAKQKAFETNYAKQHGVNVLKIQELWNKTTKKFKVAMCINYVCNKGHKHANLAYEQIGFICNTSVANVEKTVADLASANIIQHRRAEKGNYLSREQRSLIGCNPFKWIFDFVSDITNKILQTLGFRKIQWMGKVKGFVRSSSQTQVESVQLVEWFET